MVVWKHIGLTIMRSLVRNPPELLHYFVLNYLFNIFLTKCLYYLFMIFLQMFSSIFPKEIQMFSHILTL